jgi:heme oxygenase
MMRTEQSFHARAAAPSSTFTSRIVADTAPEHAALEATPFMRAVAERQLPRDQYVAMLLGYARIHRALEDALSASSEPLVRAIFRDDMRKLPLLERDIDFLCDGRPTELERALPPAAIRAIDALVRDIHEAAEHQPLALLGYLFVTEGSTLGGTVLRRYFGEAYGLTDDGLRFYSAYANPFERWKAFKHQMEATIVADDARAIVAAGAKAAFRHFYAVFAAMM